MSESSLALVDRLMDCQKAISGHFMGYERVEDVEALRKEAAALTAFFLNHPTASCTRTVAECSALFPMEMPVFVGPEEQVKGISNWSELTPVDEKKAETIGELLEKSTSVVGKLAYRAPELHDAVFTKDLEEAYDELDRLTDLSKTHPNASSMTEAELAACNEKEQEDLMSQID